MNRNDDLIMIASSIETERRPATQTFSISKLKKWDPPRPWFWLTGCWLLFPAISNPGNTIEWCLICTGLSTRITCMQNFCIHDLWEPLSPLARVTPLWHHEWHQLWHQLWHTGTCWYRPTILYAHRKHSCGKHHKISCDRDMISAIDRPGPWLTWPNPTG
jgi:hypothetical protein